MKKPSFCNSRRAFAATAAVVVACLPGLSTAQAATPQTLIEALKQGGHVVYFRHAMTESDYADQVDADPLDCSTQRTLSREGWAQARAIGEGFATHAIPVGQVLSSQYCRAWQTADLAFGRYEPRAELNFPPSEDYTAVQVAAMASTVVPLLSEVPEDANLIVVGHDDLFEAATGIYPEPQGIAFIVRPEGNGDFEVLGSIKADQWN